MKTRLLSWLGKILLGFSLLAVTYCALAAGYTASGGKIFGADGQEIQIRGISHFGFNGPTLQPQFLWAMGWKQQIAQMKTLGFNAIRVPFVPDTLYSTTTVDKLSYVDPMLNPELIGKTPLQALDLWMAEADRQGMYVMLDFHSVSKQQQYPTWFLSKPADFGLIYNNQAYTQQAWMRDLGFVAKRYSNLAHFFAIDIYNEPNGIVRWSTGDPNMTTAANFWKAAAESASTAVLAANPNLMIFVQGINGNFDGRENSTIPMNWAEDFQPEAYQALGIPNDKLVLSPHTYGPDVYMKSSFSAATYPANLAADWNTLFGQFSPQHPVVVGEWGGRYGQGPSGQKDVLWQDAFVNYLISKKIGSSFYWCYTPNSGDSGGILDDNLNVRQDKMALLNRLWAATPPNGSIPVTAPVTPPASTLKQQGIMSFAPSVGPVGTVVTVNGSGFTGSNLAWVGNAKNAGIAVVSDAVVKVTIPNGATTGAIGILNPSYAAFSASSFTVTSAPAAYKQPSIANFLPASGPAGTVVTINGSGFTGTNAAWVGNAKNAPLLVVSDTVMRVTIPQGATSGAIGIFNPSFAAFTATSFAVASSAVVYVQPGIQNFSPTSGPVGTLVTVNGTGFTGLNAAWAGAAKDAVVHVINDNQVQVKIPADATTGALGVFNPSFAAFSATAFTVQ